MPKPSDFFVGVVDFFAVLLPGALLTAVLVIERTDTGLSASVERFGDSSTVRWIAFFVAAYVVGHLLAAVGALVLDPLYDRLYRDRWQLAKPRRITSTKPKLGGRRYLMLLDAARECVEKQWRGAGNNEDFNVYQWADTYVRGCNPGASTEIQRVQADSKFFRSLVLVLMTFMLISLFGESVVLHEARMAELLGVCSLLPLAIWRFFELRWKATIYTYEYFVQLIIGRSDFAATQVNKH